jgi:uncharacterized phage protein (TIGR01671 family)
MTREIKFRGKDFLGRWHYGYLHLAAGSSSLMIQVDSFDSFGVLPETVGQFTGLLNKNKKEIWEGDIVRVGILSPNYTGSYPEPYYVDTVCIYKEGAFLYKRISPFDKKKLSRNWTYKPMHRYEIYSTEVIGNIHDTPELLKTETL